MASFVSQVFVSLTIFASLAASAPYAESHVSRHDSGWSSQQQHTGLTVAKAIYFLTNEKENAVVALPIGKDGMLSNGTVTKTGGAGSIAINGATGQPGLPDALVGQSALTVVGNVSRW
jgi:hypothetical protein